MGAAPKIRADERSRIESQLRRLPILEAAALSGRSIFALCKIATEMQEAEENLSPGLASSVPIEA